MAAEATVSAGHSPGASGPAVAEGVAAAAAERKFTPLPLPAPCPAGTSAAAAIALALRSGDADAPPHADELFGCDAKDVSARVGTWWPLPTTAAAATTAVPNTVIAAAPSPNAVVQLQKSAAVPDVDVAQLQRVCLQLSAWLSTLSSAAYRHKTQLYHAALALMMRRGMARVLNVNAVHTSLSTLPMRHAEDTPLTWAANGVSGHLSTAEWLCSAALPTHERPDVNVMRVTALRPRAMVQALHRTDVVVAGDGAVHSGAAADAEDEQFACAAHITMASSVLAAELERRMVLGETLMLVTCDDVLRASRCDVPSVPSVHRGTLLHALLAQGVRLSNPLWTNLAPVPPPRPPPVAATGAANVGAAAAVGAGASAGVGSAGGHHRPIAFGGAFGVWVRVYRALLARVDADGRGGAVDLHAAVSTYVQLPGQRESTRRTPLQMYDVLCEYVVRTETAERNAAAVAAISAGSGTGRPDKPGGAVNPPAAIDRTHTCRRQFVALREELAAVVARTDSYPKHLPAALSRALSDTALGGINALAALIAAYILHSP